MSSSFSGDNPAYSESRLEEAELIINLTSSSHFSPKLANPTLTQVNTSIAMSDALRPTLSDSHSETFVNPMTSFNDTNSNLELGAEQSPAISVSNTVDSIMEENTVSIMGQVSATTSTELMTDNADSTPELQVKQKCPSGPDLNPNVIVISVVENEDQEVGSAFKKPKALPHRLCTRPAGTSLECESQNLADTETKNKNQSKKPDDIDLTIERKKNHECVVCKAKFTSIVELFRHRVEHNENVPAKFQCEKCDMTFTEPVDLEQHELMHVENRVFQCSFCQDTFTSLHNFKCHLRIHNTRGPLVCNMCYQVFDKRSKFISHMDDHARGNVNFRVCHQCSVCKKYFSDSQKLKRHLLRHSSSKQHKCELCQKSFLERHKLTRHMLTHTGRREHTCPHCDKAFSLKHNLVTHIRIHVNERLHECHVCRRTFVQKVVLQRHMRVHQEYVTDVLEKGTSG